MQYKEELFNNIEAKHIFEHVQQTTDQIAMNYDFKPAPPAKKLTKEELDRIKEKIDEADGLICAESPNLVNIALQNYYEVMVETPKRGLVINSIQNYGEKYINLIILALTRSETIDNSLLLLNVLLDSSSEFDGIFISHDPPILQMLLQIISFNNNIEQIRLSLGIIKSLLRNRAIRESFYINGMIENVRDLLVGNEEPNLRCECASCIMNLYQFSNEIPIDNIDIGIELASIMISIPVSEVIIAGFNVCSYISKVIEAFPPLVKIDEIIYNLANQLKLGIDDSEYVHQILVMIMNFCTLSPSEDVDIGNVLLEHDFLNILSLYYSQCNTSYIKIIFRILANLITFYPVTVPHVYNFILNIDLPGLFHDNQYEIKEVAIHTLRLLLPFCSTDKMYDLIDPNIFTDIVQTISDSDVISDFSYDCCFCIYQLVEKQVNLEIKHMLFDVLNNEETMNYFDQLAHGPNQDVSVYATFIIDEMKQYIQSFE